MSKKKKTKLHEYFIKEPSPEELKSYLGIVYARVSSKTQETEGSGLQSQENRCKKFLKRINVPYHKSFLDSTTGGGDFMNRPAMRSLLKHVDSNPHQLFIVVFDDLSRLARDTQFHLKLRMAFQSRGIIPRCLNFNFDNSPEGRFSENMLAVGNEYHREANRRQVIQKQKARLESGFRGFPSVKGYKKEKDPVKGKIDIQDESAIYVKEALEGFANLKFVHKIDAVKFLQSKEVISAKQKPYKGIDTFDKMLKEVFYAGYIEYEPWDVKRRPGHHEPLISLETFEKNQRRLAGNVSFTRQDIREDFALRGLVKCADCGKEYTGAFSKGKMGKRYAYYKCATKGCGFYGKSIRRETLHHDFEKLLASISPCTEIMEFAGGIFDDVWASVMKNKDKDKERLKSQKRASESKIDALMEQLISSSNQTIKNQYEKHIEKIGREIEEIEQKLNSVYDYTVPNRTSREAVFSVLSSPCSVWQNYDVHQKQRFFHFVFDENLSYSKKNGYRTPLYTLPLRIFEELNTSNGGEVEVGGVEPPSGKL